MILLRIILKCFLEEDRFSLHLFGIYQNTRVFIEIILTTVVLSIIFSFKIKKIMATGKAMYSLVEGFQIDKIIGDVISENERKFFKKLDMISLKKVTNYCYANTYYRCCGTDYCYLCTSVDFVHQEFRERMEKNKCCWILHKGQDKCGWYEYVINNKLIAC